MERHQSYPNTLFFDVCASQTHQAVSFCIFWHTKPEIELPFFHLENKIHQVSILMETLSLLSPNFNEKPFDTRYAGALNITGQASRGRPSVRPLIHRRVPKRNPILFVRGCHGELMSWNGYEEE